MCVFFSRIKQQHQTTLTFLQIFTFSNQKKKNEKIVLGGRCVYEENFFLFFVFIEIVLGNKKETIETTDKKFIFFFFKELEMEYEFCI